jgi:transcriptional regulator with XRE-family HTH domain
MDDQRVGRIVRALRRRLGWRQSTWRRRAGSSQNLVSLIERGHMDRVSLRVLRNVLAQLDAWTVMEIRWRGAAVDRLLDEATHLFRALSPIGSSRRGGWWKWRSRTPSLASADRSTSWRFIPRQRLIGHRDQDGSPVCRGNLRKLDEKTRLSTRDWIQAVRLAARQRRRLARDAGALDAQKSSGEAPKPFRRRTASAQPRHPELAAGAGRPVIGVWFFSSRDPRVAKAAKSAGQRVRRPKTLHNKQGDAAA